MMCSNININMSELDELNWKLAVTIVGFVNQVIGEEHAQSEHAFVCQIYPNRHNDTSLDHEYNRGRPKSGYSELLHSPCF
jgi:hypothetical protein